MCVDIYICIYIYINTYMSVYRIYIECSGVARHVAGLVAGRGAGL